MGDQGSDFGLGFSVFGDRNDVVVNGPAAAGGALFQSDRLVEQTGPGIEINGVQNPAGSTTNVLAAGGTQTNRFRLNSTGSTTNRVAASGTQTNRFRPSLNAAPNRAETTSPGGSVHRPVSDSTKKWAKRFSDPAMNRPGESGDFLICELSRRLVSGVERSRRSPDRLAGCLRSIRRGGGG